jgi:hypothetical protein
MDHDAGTPSNDLIASGQTEHSIDISTSIKSTQAEILFDDWGKITLQLNGVVQHFRDVIISPSNDQQIAEEWNWKWDQYKEIRNQGQKRIAALIHTTC